ncbi:hypothetical protein C8J57DRAFT_1181716 [Mycena rebaudengoi]|nr:hypothetical protein C8J57DRAFT_1181716 [Mycena rebaudengoi]
MHSQTLAASLVALVLASAASAAAVSHTKRVDYPQFETEEECHAAGWEVCRRYVVAPGVSLWTGYPGPAEPTAPSFATEAECKAVYNDCLGYKRANGTWVWRGVEEDTDVEPETPIDPDAPIEVDPNLPTDAPIEVDPTPPQTGTDDWIWYDTEKECLTAGWDYCRSYVYDVGVTKWTGFKGTLQETAPRYKSEAECLAAGWEYCLSYKRADGTRTWMGVTYYGAQPEKPTLAIREEWIWYDTEALCLAAGWDYCRSYVYDVGVTKWTGFMGDNVPLSTSPKYYLSEESCLADGHTFCLSFKRADGTYRWFGADELGDDSVARRTNFGEDSLARRTDWIWYDTQELCLSAGWDYCRSYAYDVGVTKWVGFKGTPTTIPHHPSEAACLADGWTECGSFKRADGRIEWIGFE